VLCVGVVLEEAAPMKTGVAVKIIPVFYPESIDDFHPRQKSPLPAKPAHASILE
jgi:hypothetical protein